ncbi:unnamed protein product [Laminaria digitata]
MHVLFFYWLYLTCLVRLYGSSSFFLLFGGCCALTTPYMLSVGWAGGRGVAADLVGFRLKGQLLFRVDGRALQEIWLAFGSGRRQLLSRIGGNNYLIIVATIILY